MTDITKEDVKELAQLARIKITDDEADALSKDMAAVLDYVGVVNEIAADDADLKQVGAVYNVFRADEITNTPGEQTDTLLAEAPDREGNHLKVKKILNPDS